MRRKLKQYHDLDSLVFMSTEDEQRNDVIEMEDDEQREEQNPPVFSEFFPSCVAGRASLSCMSDEETPHRRRARQRSERTRVNSLLGPSSWDEEEEQEAIEIYVDPLLGDIPTSERSKEKKRSLDLGVGPSASLDPVLKVLSYEDKRMKRDFIPDSSPLALDDSEGAHLDKSGRTTENGITSYFGRRVTEQLGPQNGRNNHLTGSQITGVQTVRMSDMSNKSGAMMDTSEDSKMTTQSGLLDIESGRSVVVSRRRDSNGNWVVTAKHTTAPIAKEDLVFFEERSEALKLAMASRSMDDIQINSEVGILGGAWRGALRRLVTWAFDDVNGLLLSRALQLQLFFLTGYESYIVSQVIEALDRGCRRNLANVLRVAFKNRNVSRVLVQSMGLRYDFLWHWSTAITWNRAFDAWGQFPIVGITAFPATENFPSTRDHALASIFRVVLGQGNWVTRVVTRGREGLITDNPNNTAQNLAAESNGFELANRNQYGTYFGRQKTNEFRFAHRLPTDESLVRTFVANPIPTMTNNGVVHVLRQLDKHWNNMLFQEWGNFAHQRMEQLDPFEALRFHMPNILLTLSSLRGRNRWDAQVLGPMIARLQALKPALDATTARRLTCEMQDDIVVPVCSGVASLVDPFRRWLSAIWKSCHEIEKEAREVYETIASVEMGIRLGHDLMTQVNWKIPSDAVLKRAILDHIRCKTCGDTDERRVRNALQQTTPRDKRTLIELVKNKLEGTKPAKLLLGRVKTLLQRELRRELLNEAIRSLSMGDIVHGELVHDEWYWLEESKRHAAYIYVGKVSGRPLHRFIHVESGFEKIVSLKNHRTKVRAYVPVAEAICRAQKAFMTIELDHGKTFKYSAFMEFSYMRIALRRLVVVSQMTCEELDNARLNILREIQRSNQMQVAPKDLVPGNTYYVFDSLTQTYKPFECKKQYGPRDAEWRKLSQSKIVKMPPQSILVVGGGPTGLMTTIHCTENCLISGGVMKLYEARDAFMKGGSSFERAQIVRLDSRWIAMLRYHLGTGFEDVFIPASGETDSQLGNTLPTQGFVEITIKDLESMLHIEVSRLWSRGVITVFTDSKAQFDHTENCLTKLGQNLKVDDLILRRVDENGARCDEYHTWRVAELVYIKSLGIDDIRVGNEYGVWIRQEEQVLPFKLVRVDLDSRTYTFRSLTRGIGDLTVNAHNLPSVYPPGNDTRAHADVHKIVLECVMKGSKGGCVRDTLLMETIAKEKFTLDVGYTHVLEAIGKPHDSQVHICTTTEEPYGVCCIQGLKISMGMHNFGEKRWGSGIIDDIRSQNDQNTRIIGDFTKMVRAVPIVQRMYDTIANDQDWIKHFQKLVADSTFPEMNEFAPIVPKIVEACKWLVEDSLHWRRQTLQTRFFETGDNYYLGMEFTREYERWKNDLAEELIAPLSIKAMSSEKKEQVATLRELLMHHVDRLWYDGCLETIRTGDVYNPGARHRVPRLHLIDSYTDVRLARLPVGESFRLSESPEEKYEVLVRAATHVVARSVEGYLSWMSKSTKVRREGNLTRGPDGNRESKVALATFPVAHYVNHRTMRLSDKERGYVFAFIGDEQATPHFMRYSGLTGACINAMSFNNFIKKAIDGIPFVDRFREYSEETNWSNGEVVQRGTGANYGQDGFLRPGFSYDAGVQYLYSKVIEYRESQQDVDDILSRDWKVKFAASMIPRGMEMNKDFLIALCRHWRIAVFEKFIYEVEADRRLKGDSLGQLLRRREADILTSGALPKDFWRRLTRRLDADQETESVVHDTHVFVAERVDMICKQVVDFAKKAYIFNERVSSELFNQPKSVDSIVDDFAVEAQTFANSLTLSSAFASGALAFRLLHTVAANIVSAVLAGLNIVISFGTMTNAARYKIRNEEARIVFTDEKFPRIKKTVFSLMDRKTQDSVPSSLNPFFVELEQKVDSFRKTARYYDYQEPGEFDTAYEKLKNNINDLDEIRSFQLLLVSKFIVDTYHVNSYVQEALVDIYRTNEEMLDLLTRTTPESEDTAAKRLFDRLNDFEPRLENSLQRGPVRWGFVKKRRFIQWDVSTAFRYFYSLLCCSFAWRRTFLAPVQTETLGIVKGIRNLSQAHQSQVLRREIRDIEALYWATRESDVASLIFLSGFLVFLASIIFTVARIFDIGLLEDFSFWANAASATGAVLATFHFYRKFFILVNLWIVLWKKSRSVRGDAINDIRKVRRVTFTQILLTVARLCSACAAAVALPWAVAQNGFGDRIASPDLLPFWIALGAVSTAVGSTIFFFVVEYIVRYNLNPQLGPFICSLFQEEIEEMHKVLSVRMNEIDTKQVQEREAWEYTAREFLHRYRFDAVFAADRFGQILQYIQAGMDPCSDRVYAFLNKAQV